MGADGMTLVRAATMAEWETLKDIRLAALQDAPGAFLSTHDEEAAFEETDWQRRISRGGTFFAFVPEVYGAAPAGIAGAFQEKDKPATIELVSLWVRPQARGLGVGDALVAAVIDLARARNATTVHLWLTEMNKHARSLYERCGFSSTGERQPLPSNPIVNEVGMTLPLSSAH
jgi:GNAT superfamily N-acetyltransferase